MSETERIHGKNLFRVFQILRRDKIVIKMNLLGQEYERLTMVIGILGKKPPYHFHVDYPNGFERAIRHIPAWKIRFEFKGRDKVIYRFRTFGGYISGKDIYIPFPNHMERIQRRRHFRSEAPLGAKMVIPRYSKQYEMILINLSETGALVTMGKDSPHQPLFQEGDPVRRIAVLFSDEEQTFQIPIDKAMVKRLEKDPLTFRYRYALHFTDLGKSEMQELKDLIYLFQRESLKKRQRVGG